MGNFYVNQTLKISDVAPLAENLSDYQLFISPIKDNTAVIYERLADTQAVDWIHTFSNKLSATFKTPVLSVLNHDDDILYYSLHIGGETVDYFDSNPDYFGDSIELPDDYQDPHANLPGSGGTGDAELLCTAFGLTNYAEVETILRDQSYIFACHRHAALVKALGISDDAVACGWRHLVQGFVPEGRQTSDFLELRGEAGYQGYTLSR